MTLSLSGWTQGAVSLEETYLTADFKLSGIANVTDSPESGVASVLLMNWWNQSY